MDCLFVLALRNFFAPSHQAAHKCRDTLFVFWVARIDWVLRFYLLGLRFFRTRRCGARASSPQTVRVVLRRSYIAFAHGDAELAWAGRRI